MDFKSEVKLMSKTLSGMVNGEKFTPKLIPWIPSTIEESKIPTFIQAVKSAYEINKSEIDFDGSKFEVSFVKEENKLTYKPGIRGRFDIMLNEQRITSFTDLMKAKVFIATRQPVVDNSTKKSFTNSTVKSIKTL